MSETEISSTLKKPIKTHALKDHSQISAIIDILGRAEHHHLMLTHSFSEKINLALLDALALHLDAANTPKKLRNIDIIYSDIRSSNDYSNLLNSVLTTEKPIIVALNQCPIDLVRQLHALPYCHLIIFAEHCPKELTHIFSRLKLKYPSYMDLLNILKSLRSNIENAHHIIIPDETLTSALSMASHYFSTESRLDEALQLLDSAAARASGIEHQDGHKPIVTTTLLTNVVSNRTQIPVSHLHNNKYQAIQVNHALQKRIYGQDAAIALISSTLQQACVKLNKKDGPLCSFLLVGPSDVGKTEAAYAIAEHLFGSSDSLLHVNLCKSHYASFSEIKVIASNHNTHSMTLLEAIRQTPYAVILIENINQAPAGTLDLFKDIFIQGYTVDSEGSVYDFRNAVIIMTTTIGAEKISHIMQAPHTHETPKTVDLMQLVLNDNLHDSSGNPSHQHSPDELCEEIMPTLEAYFSATLLQSLHVIPFIPLDYAALEKIMRLKVKTLAKNLDMKFGIELNYAPEIIKFIAHETLWRKPHAKSLEKILEQHLYSCVAHEILAHSDDKNRSKRLLLQLNENGQMLRCEFMSASEAGVYTL